MDAAILILNIIASVDMTNKVSNNNNFYQGGHI